MYEESPTVKVGESYQLGSWESNWFLEGPWTLYEGTHLETLGPGEKVCWPQELEGSAGVALLPANAGKRASWESRAFGGKEI